MINLKDKSFKNNLTGEIVRVLDSFEDIAILEDRSRVDSRHLANPSLYTEIVSRPINENLTSLLSSDTYVEEIKPENFFSNQGAYNSLADKIKNIPQHLIKDDPTAGQAVVRIEDPDGNTSTAFDNAVNNESAIIQINPEDERAALAAKYNIVNPAESINKQNEAFSSLLGEDTPPNEEVRVTNVEEVQRFDVNPNQYQNEYIQDDPIIKMFKGVKRNLDFNISIDISNRIPRLDFIEMMEDSYETSIIDFLADEFTNNIVRNPENIREIIKSKINELVYDKVKKESVVKTLAVEDELTINGSSMKPVTKRATKPRATTRKNSAKKEESK